ncbi:CU044_2847 family protein [Phytohabitans rumicis]|uniref:Trypsin-co-occurring domain-containing protein n=1 Tax=Phytohabitans rumicis TaxID=1076125 RepID=A0A6V8LG99_9ACTN|nr:CU044_2847 family protein [Phytohabitans rumicis]GFJ93126.1 hypothetical protein Prum_067680 [Phytohabitans rumicis]
MSKPTYLVAVSVDGGDQRVVVEVEDDLRGVGPAAVDGETVIAVGWSMLDGFETLRLIADALISKASALSRRPDAIELELAVKFNAQAGVVLAKTAAEGAVKVTFTWDGGHRSPGPPAESTPSAG